MYLRWPSAKTVSNASVDLPEPDNPVTTTSWSRGMSIERFLRLCSRAPRMRMCFRLMLVSRLRPRQIVGSVLRLQQPKRTIVRQMYGQARRPGATADLTPARLPWIGGGGGGVEAVGADRAKEGGAGRDAPAA